MNIDREELAWAAGFYDGEGSTFLRKSHDIKRPSMGISQLERLPLERFQAAVGGLGRIYPGSPSSGTTWMWHANRVGDTYTVIALLWHWLSEPKRWQARRVLGYYNTDYEARRQRNRNRRKTSCVRGHPFDDENTYLVVATGGRRCRACDKMRRSLRTQRQREAAALTAAGDGSGVS